MLRPTEGARTIQVGVREREAEAGAAVDRAYEAAREVEAKFTGASLRALLANVRSSLQGSGLDKELTPGAVRALKSLGRLDEKVVAAGKNARLPFVKLAEFELARRKLGAYIGAAKNPTDKRAATKIKVELDRWLDDAVDNELFAGNANALELLKGARALRRDYGAKFQMKGTDDEAGRIVKRILDEGRTPEEVANYLFGKAGIGAGGASVRAVRRLREIFGADSAEMSALKEMGWLRLTREIGQEGFSPLKYRRRLETAFDGAETLMGEIYAPAEIALMRRFRTEVMRTVTPEAARNPSRTAFTLSRLARDFMGRVGTVLTFGGHPAAGAAAFVAKRAPDMMGERAARRAVSELPPRRQPFPGFVSTGEAGVSQIE